MANRQVAVVGQSYRKDNASMFLKPGIVVRPSAKEGESVGSSSDDHWVQTFAYWFLRTIWKPLTSSQTPASRPT